MIAGGGDTPSIVLLESDSGVNEEDEVEEEEENEKGKEDVRKPSFVSAKEVSYIIIAIVLVHDHEFSSA